MSISLLEADKPFELEINGPKVAETALFLVHGFGVRRDSRGLFTDLEKLIADKVLCLRGDYSDFVDGSIRVIPITTQARRLERIVQFVRDTYKAKRFVYLGHSQGCLVIAEANPTDSNVLLLAPPIDSPAERFAETEGWKRPGSLLNTNGESLLMRSDGSTQVGADYWTDFRNINVQDLYTQLNRRNKVQIIFAGGDKVLGQQIPPTGIASQSISTADHDFRGEPRGQLLNLLVAKIVR